MATEHTLAENLLRMQSATEYIVDAIIEKGGECRERKIEEVETETQP